MWVLVGWAKGRHRNGTEQATRVQSKRPDRDINEEYDMVREATALYKRLYIADWPDETGHTAYEED